MYRQLGRLLSTPPNFFVGAMNHEKREWLGRVRAALTEFGGIVPAGAIYRLLADRASYKPSLEVAARKWCAQHRDARPLEFRLTGPRILHDRAIFIDREIAWTLTQSLKDFAKRSHAELVRADDIAALKIPAYERIWDTAEVIV